MSLEALTTRMPTPDPTTEARIQASMDVLQAQTRGDPERLAVLRAQMARTSAHPCRRRNPSRGSTARRLAAEISIVTIKWKLLDHARRVDGTSGAATLGAGAGAPANKAGGFSPAKLNALKGKTDSSLATSAGTFVAAPKHWELEWVWPARGWQSKEDRGRLTMAWVPIMW